MNDQPAINASAPETSPVKQRVLIADDHPMFRRGVIDLIATTNDFEVVAEAGTPQETLAKIREIPIDIELLDVSFHGTNGIELTKQIRAEKPDLRIILLSMHDEELYALRAVKSGAQGYVMKRENPNVLIDALRKVAEGSVYLSTKVTEGLVYRSTSGEGASSSPIDELSDRELEVLQLFGEGNGTQEIATRLNLSPKTIETHRMHIKEKLGFGSASEMVRFAASWVRLQAGDQPRHQ